MDYSLADVVKLTGGKRRSVQLWAEAGAILAYPRTEKRGTGIHRRFNRDEVIIACCLNGLARRQVGIGELVRIGRGLRAFLKHGDGRQQLERNIYAKSEWEFYLTVIWHEDDEPAVLLLPEEDFSGFLGVELKGRGLAIVMPLRKALSALKGSSIDKLEGLTKL